MTDAIAPRKTAIDRFLNRVERVGNALPDPTTLFALMALAVIGLSAVVALFDVAAVHPKTGEEVRTAESFATCRAASLPP